MVLQVRKLVNEKRNILIKKLIHNSMYMGCRENDIIFGSFAVANLVNMSDQKLFLYAALLQQNDADLLSWVTKQSPADKKFIKIITQIIDYVDNKNGQ